MQTVSRSSSNGLGPQARRIASLAILLFALSGLISGFAIGAFVKPKLGNTTPNTGNGNTVAAQQAKTATPTHQPAPVRFDIPQFVAFPVPLEKADGNTTYSISAHLVKVVDEHGQPVIATNLTCKLWLIPRVPDNQLAYIPPDIAKNIASIGQPITSQGTDLHYNLLPGVTFPDLQGLIFSTTPQVQPCSTNSPVTWKYKIATSITSGKYDLIVLFDWLGKHWNYSWAHIKVTQGS